MAQQRKTAIQFVGDSADPRGLLQISSYRGERRFFWVWDFYGLENLASIFLGRLI